MNELPDDISRRRLVWISLLTTVVFSVYFWSIFLHDDSFFGFQFRDRYLVLFIIGSVVLAIWLCSKIPSTYVSLSTNVHLSVLTTLLLLVVVDVAYTIIQNTRQPVSAVVGYGRNKDVNYWFEESVPPPYYQTPRNFMLYKPNITIKGSTFGQQYKPDLLRSPTLVNSVLERRTVAVSINRLGFREADPIEHARIFALGDSFTFGWHVNVDKTWVKRLEQMLHVPIYNLGVSGASPKQELELLKHLINADPPIVTIRHLLWMICEGNDLEDSYADMAPAEPLSLTRGTVLETLRDLPKEIRKESFVVKMMRGEIQYRYAPTEIDSSHYSIDGVNLVTPLFRSDHLGYKLFFPDIIDRARRSMSYVMSHPNRPKLEQVFKEMRQLAHKYGFKVTVILAPTAPRLQGKYFSDFPEVSDEPYFLEFVANLARKENFQVVNLYDGLRPFASQRLLYFRDDAHWNEEGHHLAATSLTQRLSILSPQSRANQ